MNDLSIRLASGLRVLAAAGLLGSALGAGAAG